MQAHVSSFAALSLLALSGCVSVTQTHTPVPSDASIVVLTPGKPQKLFFANYADVKNYIPFYGFAKLIEADSAESLINSELSTRGFKVEQELQRALVRDIRARNVEAISMTIGRPAAFRPRALKSSDLPSSDGAWAMIDARISAYGINAEMSGEFRPFVCVIVRMIDVQSKKILYNKSFVYNYWGGKAVRIPFDPADKWEDIEAVKNDLSGVQTAITTALSKITKLIATDVAVK